jgi:hypothetical protein
MPEIVRRAYQLVKQQPPGDTYVYPPIWEIEPAIESFGKGRMGRLCFGDFGLVPGGERTSRGGGDLECTLRLRHGVKGLLPFAEKSLYGSGESFPVGEAEAGSAGGQPAKE